MPSSCKYSWLLVAVLLQQACSGSAASHRAAVGDGSATYFVSRIDNNELDLLVLRSRGKPVTERVRAMQRDLLVLVAHNATALGCFPFAMTEAGRTEYRGETVHFFAPAGVPLPGLEGTRFEPSENEDHIENLALADCRARVLLHMGSDGGLVRLPQKPGVEAVAVYCVTGITRNGVPAKNYPDGSRGFIGFREEDGRWRLLREPGRRLHGLRFTDVQRLRQSQCREGEDGPD